MGRAFFRPWPSSPFSISAYNDFKVSATQFPPPTPGNLADLRTFLIRYQVGTVIVYPIGHAPEGVVRYVSALLGPPQWRQGVDAWFGVQKTLSRPAPG